MVTLAADRYDDVRRVVDPTLDAEALPDELIASDPYAGRAARTLGREVPGVADDADAQRALVYLTAANLLERLPVVKSAGLPDHTTTFDRPGWKENAAIVRRMAMEEIDALRPSRSSRSRPVFFTVASGRRA